MNKIEEKIIYLMKSGNKEFINLIYDNYGDALYGIVLRIIKNEATAKDVMQESFVKVWKNHKNYDSKKARLFTWLLQIFRNTAIDHHRKIQKIRKRMIQNGLENVKEIGINSFSQETIDLHVFIDKLEEKYKEVIKLLYYSGLTHEEASERLSIPLGTVKSRLRIGINHLRKIYGSNYILVLVYVINLL